MFCSIRRDGTGPEPLSSGLEDAILSLWQGCATASEREISKDFINQLHQRSMWLSCGCVGSEVTHDERPMLAPAKKDDTLFLRRLTSRSSHAAKCLFWHDQIVNREAQVDEEGRAKTFTFSVPSFLANDTNNGKLSNSSTRSSSASDPTHTESLTKQAKRLFWLAEMSGWQYAPNETSSVSSVLSFSQSHLIGQTPLRDLLFCDSRGWTEAWYKSSFERCKKAGMPAACWWIQLAVDFNKETRVITYVDRYGSDLQIPVYGEMKIFGGDASPARFPLVVIALIREGPSGAYLESAYAHPVLHEKKWMLVDSDFERKTYNDLSETALSLITEKQIQLGIYKPIFSMPETGERPDFVLSVKTKSNLVAHLVVETMGFDDADYMARKQVLASKIAMDIFYDHRRNFLTFPNESLKKAVFNWAVEAAR